MKKSIVISEQDSIAALLENDRVVEFFVNRGELLLGDIYTATVENILPGIDAAFVNLGKDKMGFLHANDVPGQGPLKERLVPKQKLLVQITKEPTGHKGPRVSTAISLPGRFLVLVPEERGVSISRRISEARERARLKSVVNLLKPPGVGLIIRTEAKGQGEPELFEDFEQLWDRWQSVVSDGEASIGPTLIYRDQDLLYRVIRDAYSTDVNEIIVDSPDGQRRAQEFLFGWAGKQTQVGFHIGEDSLLVARGIDREIEAALSDRVELPSGGHLNIQPTEALTVIDVNSGRFTSSRTQAETVRRTNLEAAQEIPRQLRLRNIGGMVIVDFIDMDSRKDQQQVLEAFQRTLEDDRAKPQIGQLSDLGLVELTRRRQGQSLRELFTAHCPTCIGLGVVPTLEIGPAENRRAISTKPREEDLVAKGRGQARRASRGQPGAIRAATVSSGRVQSTVVDLSRAEPGEEEYLAEVPAEILEQMPDDLLDPRLPQAGFGSGGFGARSTSLDEEEEAEEEELLEELTVESFAPQPALFEEDFEEEEEVAEVLGAAVEEVEELRQQLVQDLEDEGAGATAWEPEYQEEAPMPYSPYEAEPEPITGVFRLKAKPATDAGAQTRSADKSEDEEKADPDRSAHTPEAGSSEESDDPGTGFVILNSKGEESGPTESGERSFQSEGSERAERWWSESSQLELPLPGSQVSEPEAEPEEMQVTAGFPGGNAYGSNTDSSIDNGKTDED